MRLHVRTLAVVAFSFLVASPVFAGKQRPHMIVAGKATASPNATAKFTCEQRFFDPALNGGQIACYGPSAIRSAYGLSSLIGAGFDGTGKTIVILDAFGSPTALADLQAFDTTYGLPAPPSFTVVTMPGTPAFDPTNGDMVGWAEEVSLDVQWSHAMAPGAKIVLIAAASDSDDDLTAGLNYALDHRLGDVVSMSFGESEAALTDADGKRVIKNWEKAFARAAALKVTLFVSSGDEGSTNTADAAGDVYPFPNVSYPASSPQVTGVGGTSLFFGIGNKADPNGAYIGETVWNDETYNIGIDAAGGGGVSALFGEPLYQALLPFSAQKLLKGHRGVPDVSYNGGVVGGVIVHLGFPGIPSGFYIFGGTSAGAPQWAATLTDLNQVAGRPAGFLNNRLYLLGALGVLSHLTHDVTTGNNTFCETTIPNGVVACIPGFSATKGWDAVTGWGSPNLGKLLALFNDWDIDD
jgi:subtilase family serine protease